MEDLEKSKDTSFKFENKPEKSKTGLIVFAIIAFAGIAGLIYLMIISSPETSESVKDIAIVLFVFSFLLSTAALIILIVQTARLINLLKNEIKPVLETTKETVNEVKGTVSFLGDKAVTPVIQMNSKFAGVAKIAKILIPGKHKKKGS